MDRLLRSQIRNIVVRSDFKYPKNLKAIELCLIRSIEISRSYRPPTWKIQSQYQSHKVGMKNLKCNPVGRPNISSQRAIIISAIYRAWRLGTNEKPKINKRLPGSKQTAFVRFAEQILWLVGITNVIDNLHDFRSKTNRLTNSSYIQVLNN